MIATSARSRFSAVGLERHLDFSDVPHHDVEVPFGVAVVFCHAPDAVGEMCRKSVPDKHIDALRQPLFFVVGEAVVANGHQVKKPADKVVALFVLVEKIILTDEGKERQTRQMLIDRADQLPRCDDAIRTLVGNFIHLLSSRLLPARRSKIFASRGGLASAPTDSTFEKTKMNLAHAHGFVVMPAAGPLFREVPA